MIRKKVKQRGSAHIVAIVLLVVVVSVITGYIGLKSYENRKVSSEQPAPIETSTQKPETSGVSNLTVSEMGRQIKMQMSKADVENRIGSPSYCTELKQVEDTSVKYETQRCRYGDPNAAESFDVTYMNEEVWGTTSVKN